MLGQGLFVLFVLALWIYCIFDCIRTDESSIQNLPKMVWLLIVIFVPTIGSIAWLLLGRPAGASFQLSSGSSQRTPPAHPSGRAEPQVAADSDDYQRRREEALRRYHEERERQIREREEDLRRREEELRKREGGGEPA